MKLSGAGPVMKYLHMRRSVKSTVYTRKQLHIIIILPFYCNFFACTSPDQKYYISLLFKTYNHIYVCVGAGIFISFKSLYLEQIKNNVIIFQDDELTYFVFIITVWVNSIINYTEFDILLRYIFYDSLKFLIINFIK